MVDGFLWWMLLAGVEAMLLGAQRRMEIRDSIFIKGQVGALRLPSFVAFSA